MEENVYKKSGGNFWAGMLIGLAVGAGVSMLYAPKSGAETRAMLRERARQVGDSASDTYNKAKQKVSELRGKAQEKANEFRGKAQEKADEMESRSSM